MNYKITELGKERINELLGEDIFPLQTIQSMADRWGVTKQRVNNWRDRHDNFPKPIEGLLAVKTPFVYPLYEVKRYEKEQRLKCSSDYSN